MLALIKTLGKNKVRVCGRDAQGGACTITRQAPICLGGGIGRHNGLKIRCSYGREGSSPSRGTILKAGIAQLVEHLVAIQKVASSSLVSCSNYKTSFIGFKKCPRRWVMSSLIGAWDTLCPDSSAG